MNRPVQLAIGDRLLPRDHRSSPPGCRPAAALCVLLGLGALWSGSGCLGPQVEDEIQGTGAVLPAGTEVAMVAGQLAAQIAEWDGVDGTVPALSGFADGQPIVFWDFGVAWARVAPIYYLVDPMTRERIDHPGIIDAVPGDGAYTPMWLMVDLPVTAAYAGEIVPSVSAIEEAQRLGLIESPVLPIELRDRAARRDRRRRDVDEVFRRERVLEAESRVVEHEQAPGRHPVRQSRCRCLEALERIDPRTVVDVARLLMPAQDRQREDD
ncbi:MAG: hypothetical protein AAGC55_11055, partial [Myxococcota bacterium]